MKIFGSWNQRQIYIKMEFVVKLRCLTELRQCWLEGRKFIFNSLDLFLVYPNDGIAILREPVRGLIGSTDDLHLLTDRSGNQF